MNAPTRAGDWMQTHSGIQFWPTDPRPEDIRIDDIAHALSMLCRFGGHCRTFYSVAEHSILITEKAPLELKKWALLHDAPEGLGLVDLIHPVKRSMSEYKRHEERMQRAVAERFDLPWPMPPEIKVLDQRILLDEKNQLMGPEPAPWGDAQMAPVDAPLDVRIYGLSPNVARNWFLQMWEEIQ